MKSVITASCLLLSLVILFVIVACKDSSSGDNAAVQQETVTRKPTTVTTLKPVEKQIELQATETKLADEKMMEIMQAVAENKPAEIKPVTETKPPAETKPAEVKPVETKHAETKPVAEAKPEEKVKPAAVPVATVEEAEKLNAEALVEFEIQQKRIAKERARLERGFRLVFSELFEEYKTVPMTKANEDTLKKKGYDVEKFKKREIPGVWTVDYSTIPTDVSFKKTDDGYSIVSPQGNIRFMGQRLNGMGSSFLFELTVKNKSNNESEIIFGVHDSGLVKNGNKTLATEKLSSKEEKTIEVELSVFEQLANIAPTISVKGEVVLNDLTIYRKDHNDFTIVEGEIVERSTLPDPKDTDYPDCRYTAHFVGNAILSGIPCNKELALSIDGFEDKKELNTNTLKAGDKILCAIVPIDSIPVELASIEEADDLSLFQLENYLLVSCEKIVSFSDITHNDYYIDFKDSEYISIFDRRINPEIGKVLIEKQDELINQDKERIKKILSNYSDDQKKEINQRFLKAWDEEQIKDPPGFNRINGHVWRNMNGSFFALSEKYNLIEDYPLLSQNNIDSLVALRDFLETQGVQLLVSLIPYQQDIAARVICKDFQNIPDFRAANIVKQLLDNNIETIYMSDEIIRNYNKYPFTFLSPAIDSHPADVAQDVSSSIVAERLSRFAFPKSFDEKDFSVKKKIHSYMKPAERYVYPTNCDIGENIAGEPYLCNQILYKNHDVGRTYSDSPILIMSNSFGDTPSGSSFSDYLSMKTRIKNYTYIVTGQAVVSTAMQRLFNHPENFLKGKKVLILHLGLNHLLSCFIPNFRDLDAIKKIESNLSFKKSLAVVGNEKEIPDFAQNMLNPSLFKIGDKKEQTIINMSIDDLSLNLDQSKNLYAVIDYVCIDSDKLSLTCNSVEKSLSGTYHRYRSSSKTFFAIPNNIENIQISVHGRSGAIIAIQSIKLYQ